MDETRLVAAITGMSDIEAAHRGHAQAVDRLRQLEGELDHAFEQLHNARRELHDRAGVDAIIHLDEPMTCAFDRWHAIREANTRAEHPPDPASLDAHREREALRIANAAKDDA